KKQKLKLVFTKRAVRLFTTSLVLFAIITLLGMFLFNPYPIKTAVPLFFLLLSFALIILSNILLKPIENQVNNWYYNDAARILKQMPDLLIIGITGSYGKTSTKHFLHRILSEKYNVLMTPGSYNTTMGVIRTIRENLNSTHQIFIVEMGAKQKGDIKEICDLVKPKIGILTAIGEQHLETFKNIEEIRKTKFELIDSLPKNGYAILNADYEHVANTKVNNTNSFYYSVENTQVEFLASDIKYSSTGSSFNIIRNNNIIANVKTPIVGEYNISNILACFVVADNLKININDISYAIKKIKPVTHRMEFKRNANGITIIDDAFNSNPKGAFMAVNVLKQMDTGKRIIITPGFVELGEKENYYNEEFGKQIANSVDFAILVDKKQTHFIHKGLIGSNFNQDNIYIATNLDDAINKMNLISEKGDTILFENDLPDTYLN
ncbi:MAG: hypothetical protein B6I20_08310, partial [Bacteroidetes bacterium 4572_117]